MALRGCESAPRRSALISGDWMNNRYRESWKSDRPQKTTCSYFTGTTETSSPTQVQKWDITQTVFGKQIVCSPDDELGHQSTEFLKLLFAFGLDEISSHRISTTNDVIFKILAKVILGAQEFGIGEAEEGEVLREVVLCRVIERQSQKAAKESPVLGFQ